MKNTLSIQGKEINYEYKLVDINNINFYRSNPRIATILSEYKDEITNDIIDKTLWDRNTTKKLYRRIEKDGGLIHPILVYNNDVLEGNTRLCCYRHLYSKQKNDKWKYIKCNVINDNISSNDIYRLLCSEHIEGKIDWETYEKANLYFKMNQEENMTYDSISEIVGESAPTVSIRIKAFKLMVDNGIVDKNKYSHFDQLVRNPELNEIGARNPEITDKTIELIKSEKIPKATDIRKIGDIYKHKKARKRLFTNNENIEQVYHDLKAKAPMTDSSFMKDIEKLIKKVKYLKREEREGLKQCKKDCFNIEKLVKELISLCEELDVKIFIPKNIRKG